MAAFLVLITCLGFLGTSAPVPSSETQATEARPGIVARVPVELVERVRLTDVELETVRDQLGSIWRQEGIEVVFLTSPPAPPAGPHLRLVLADVPIQPSAETRNLCALGSIRFVNGTPEPELLVSVTTVRDFVRRALPGHSPGVRLLVAARIIGRVAAHEMGHYLLHDAGHQPTGLMRARMDGADLLAPHLKPFAPPRRARLYSGLALFAGEAR